MHPNLAHALRRGWKIFPLIHKSRFAVSQPFLERATDSVEQVELWQTEYPNCEWAVATGQHSRVFALELSVDVGFKTLRSQCPKQSDFMDTLQTKTPSWVTLFYQWPDGGFPTYARVHAIVRAQLTTTPASNEIRTHKSDVTPGTRK